MRTFLLLPQIHLAVEDLVEEGSAGAAIRATFAHDFTIIRMYLYNTTLYRLLLVDSDFPWDAKLSLDPFAKRSGPTLVCSSRKTFPTNRTRGCNAVH